MMKKISKLVCTAFIASALFVSCDKTEDDLLPEESTISKSEDLKKPIAPSDDEDTDIDFGDEGS